MANFEPVIPQQLHTKLKEKDPSEGKHGTVHPDHATTETDAEADAEAGGPTDYCTDEESLILYYQAAARKRRKEEEVCGTG